MQQSSDAALVVPMLTLITSRVGATLQTDLLGGTVMMMVSPKSCLADDDMSATEIPWSHNGNIHA